MSQSARVRFVRPTFSRLVVPPSVASCLCVCLEILDMPHYVPPTMRRRVWSAIVTDADGFVSQCHVLHANGEVDE